MRALAYIYVGGDRRGGEAGRLRRAGPAGCTAGGRVLGSRGPAQGIGRSLTTRTHAGTYVCTHARTHARKRKRTRTCTHALKTTRTQNHAHTPDNVPPPPPPPPPSPPPNYISSASLAYTLYTAKSHYFSPSSYEKQQKVLAQRAAKDETHRCGQEGDGWRADVWSLGCCVLAMGTLTTPIGTRSVKSMGR